MTKIQRSILAAVACCCGIAVCRSSLAAVVAFDGPDPEDPAYADGWEEGDNGGFGFLPWTGGMYGNPIAIDTEPAPDNDLGNPAFQLGTGGQGSWAVRPFAAGIEPGQSLRIDFDPFTFTPDPPDSAFNWMFGLRSTSGDRLSLYSYDYYSGGVPFFGGEKFGVYATSANSNLNGGASLPTTGCGGGTFCTGYTTADGSDGFTLTVDVLTLNTYRMRIEDDGIMKLDITGQLQLGTRADQKIIDFFLWTEEGSNEIHTTYFSNIEIFDTPSEGLAGDYSGDGNVDAADYTIWRNNLGGDAAAFAAGTRNPLLTGPVSNQDYAFWKSNFEPSGGGATAGGFSSTVPEPASWFGMLLGAMTGLRWLRRRADGHVKK